MPVKRISLSMEKEYVDKVDAFREMVNVPRTVLFEMLVEFYFDDLVEYLLNEFENRAEGESIEK